MTLPLADAPHGFATLYRVAQVRTLEALAFRALPSAEVMERAGRAAADWLEALAAARRRVLVLAGPGNNGGDGVVAARYLHERGFDVTVVSLADQAQRATGDAAQAWQRLPAGVARRTDPAGLDPEVVVDALFGIGLARPLGEPFAAWVHWSSALPASVLRLAIDVPSGLDADRGIRLQAAPGACFAADATITFIADKPGLHTGDGPDCAGRVTVEPLGLDRSSWPAADGALSDRTGIAAFMRRLRRPMNSHKGSFGALAVVGGDAGTVGAVLLAARAALCLGAGRVQVGFVSGPPLACDPSAPELMLRTAEGALAMRPDAIAVGPGLGQRPAGQAALQASLASPAHLVIDADGLNQLAVDPTLRTALGQRPAPAVLTPHPLEAARLLACGAADVQSDRIDAARRLASADRTIVVLKGAGTVVAAPDGRWWINASGGPALATAGTGDVLTGMIGALLVQGLAPLEASLAAVWLHGAAADRWAAQHNGATGMAASELIAPARALANELIAQAD